LPELLASARSGDIVSAEKEADTLQSLHEQLVNIKDEYKAKQVLIQIKASQAWISMAKGNTRQAIAYMAEATDMEENTAKPPVTPGEVLPARELLGDLFLEMDKPQEALECYEIDLKLHPNRFNGIYGAAIAAKQSGNREMARKYFEKLVKLAENSNNDRPEIIEAKAFLGRNKIAT
ncbi:tetratricopeptide repeat protein, partial [Pricia sp.]|uniref:tetratricopeptide repeat protein n=1 Tax=Pricia sp. TaxID=2268138 RepID=UPI003593EF3C